MKMGQVYLIAMRVLCGMYMAVTELCDKEVNFKKSQKLLASRAGSLKQTIARTAFTQPAIEIG